MNIVQAEAAPFLFKRGNVGCLLVHGFTGAPAEMRWLGEQLAESGFSTLGVRLFAHGTDLHDMLRAKWQDWYLSVIDGYYLLRGQCDQIFIIGLSMGGVLALLLGAEYPVSGIVTLSTPIQIPLKSVRPFVSLIPIISPFWRFKSKGTPDWVNPELEKDHIDYPAYPLIAVYELHLLMKKMRERVSSIQVPTLIIHSKTDQSIPSEHPNKLLELLGSSDKELVWLENSGHVITRDVEKVTVLNQIIGFITRISQSNKAAIDKGNPI